jgi:NADPH:quinone reductase-like Zn-dependent oxidoreductase
VTRSLPRGSSIQIANAVGAIPIAVTRTSAKKEALLSLGAAYVVASAEDDLAARLNEIAGQAAIRVIFDAVGGPIFEPLTAAMSRGGILIEYGGLSPEPTPFPLLAVLSKTLTLRGYLVHEIVSDPLRLQAAKAFVLDGVASGALTPVIAKDVRFRRHRRSAPLHGVKRAARQNRGESLIRLREIWSLCA